jgi:hypothetical protein
LENHRSVLVFLLQPSTLLYSDFPLPDAPLPLRQPCAEHRPPRAALNRATCNPNARAAASPTRASLLLPLHVTPPLPEPPRLPPAASSYFRATPPSSGPRAPPGASHAFLLAFTRLHSHDLFLSRAPPLVGPPPQPRAAVVSHPGCLCVAEPTRITPAQARGSTLEGFNVLQTI